MVASVPLSTGIQGLDPGTVALVGIPWDEGSSYLRGAALAPAEIRAALHHPSSNMTAESGLDLDSETRLCILGDLDLADSRQGFARIEKTLGQLLDRAALPLSLGGDHSISLPILRSYAGRCRPLTLLQIDAHPDLYDEYEGDRYSHACPFARIMEEGLVDHLIQIGIRTATPYQRQQAHRFGVEMVEMKDHRPEAVSSLQGSVYVSLDLDALDPAFAPGVSHHEPGGLSTREVLDLLHSISGEVVGADIVELNPRRDPQGLTARVAAKLAKELVALMLKEPPPTQVLGF